MKSYDYKTVPHIIIMKRKSSTPLLNRDKTGFNHQQLYLT